MRQTKNPETRTFSSYPAGDYQTIVAEDNERLKEYEFCAQLTADTAECIDKLIDTPTHLPNDTLVLSNGNLVAKTITSPTNIGLTFASLVAMRDMGLHTAEHTNATTGAMLMTLERLENDNGLFYNWYDTNTGAAITPPEGKIISTIEGGWAYTGLLILKNAGCGEQSTRAAALLDAMDITRLFDRKKNLFYGHYNSSLGQFSNYHNDMLLSETRIASYIAMSKGKIEPSHFNQLGRFAPAGKPQSAQAKTGAIKSWGGSMFEDLMPRLFLTQGEPGEIEYAQREHIQNQIEYGQRYLNGSWGVSVCRTPDGYKELGVPANAAEGGYPAGTVITAHAKLLALPFAREQVIASTMQDCERYPGYNKPGFGICDAVDTANGKMSDAYLVLDQAMILLALYNDWYKDAGGMGRYVPELSLALAA